MAPRCLLALALSAAILAGCSVSGPEHDGAASVVAFDVRPLFASAGPERCVTVVESLSLGVEDADGARQTRSRDLLPDDAEVTFSVTVAPGPATFTAEVLSNNGTVLYRGTAREDVEEDGFRVDLPLQAVDAVLKACPDRVPLRFDDDAYRGTLAVINRGSDPVAWSAALRTPCDVDPCLELSPSDTTTAAGDTTGVAGDAGDEPIGTTFDVRITSAVGTLDVVFEIVGGGP